MSSSAKKTPPPAPVDVVAAPSSDETPPPAAAPRVFPVVAGLVLLVGAGILSYSLLGAGGKSITGARPPGSADDGLPLVSSDTVRVAPFSVSQRVAGVVMASQQATLRARVNGQVAAVSTNLGARVEKGALLVALDSGTLGPELERAKAAAQVAAARVERAKVVLADATAEMERRLRLVAQGASAARTKREATTAKALAEVDLALAEAEAKRASAEVDIIRVQLEQRRTRAPFAGEVSAIDLDVGESVTAGRELVTVVAKGPPRVHFGLAEGAARSLKLGDEIRVWTDEGEHFAKVERIGAAISGTDRVRSIEAVFPPESEGTLLVGGFADVEILAKAPEKSPLVSMLALRGRGANRHAFVIGEGGVVEKRAVKILVEDGETAAVEGLSLGDVVVKSGAPRLKSGTKVQVLK